MSASSEPIDSKQENPSAPGVETEQSPGAAQGDAQPSHAQEQDVPDDTDAVALLAQAQEQVAQYHEELLRAIRDVSRGKRYISTTVAQQMADRLAPSLRAIVDTQEVVKDQADYLVSGEGRRGTVRLIKSGEMSEVGARK